IASLFLLGKPSAHGVAAVHASTAGISLPARWALYIFLVWAGGAAIGIARVGRGLLRVYGVKGDCVALGGSVVRQLQPALASPITRPFRILTSASARVPSAIGFFHPAIVLPSWAIHELSTEELNAIVLHESAHLQRWDDWTNLAQKAIRAL